MDFKPIYRPAPVRDEQEFHNKSLVRGKCSPKFAKSKRCSPNSLKEALGKMPFWIMEHFYEEWSRGVPTQRRRLDPLPSLDKRPLDERPSAELVALEAISHE